MTIKQTQKQMGWWLNRFDFAFAQRNTLNTGHTIYNKTALDLIENASNEMDKVAERGIQQAITQGLSKLNKLNKLLKKFRKHLLDF